MDVLYCHESDVELSHPPSLPRPKFLAPITRLIKVKNSLIRISIKFLINLIEILIKEFLTLISLVIDN